MIEQSDDSSQIVVLHMLSVAPLSISMSLFICFGVFHVVDSLMYKGVFI